MTIDVEQHVIEVVRASLPKSISSKYKTNQDFRSARLYHDLRLWGDSFDELVWEIEDRLGIDVVTGLKSPTDCRPICPPEFWSWNPFYNLWKDLVVKPDDFWPVTVQHLIDACRIAEDR